jgi:hypothetical protein
MNAQPDPLIIAHAKIADLQLDLARARAFVRDHAERPLCPDSLDFAKRLLASIERNLEGTMYSPKGAKR